MTRHLLIVLGVVVALLACTSIDCPVQNTVRTVYAFRNVEGTADTLKDTMMVVSARINRTDTTLLKWSTGMICRLSL